MERLVLECSVRAVLIAGGTAAILRLMGARTAAARHAAWAGVLLFMLVLPVWTAWGPKAELRLLPPSAVVPQAIAPTASRSKTAAAPIIDTPAIPSDASNDAPRGFAWSFWTFVLGLYAAGVLWLLTRLAIGTMTARRLRRDAVESPGGLLTSTSCAAPVTIGWLRPAIILPQAWREWTHGRLDAVVEHERAHVRRRDPLVQWLALLNRAIFWFHPLAWWLERKLASLAEEACDAAVLDQGHDPAEYAEVLLDIERSVKQAGARMEAIGMAMPGRGLPERIKLIFDGPRWPRMSRIKIACMAAACSATAAVFGAGTLERPAQFQLPPVRLQEVHAPGLDAIPAPTASMPKSSGELLAQSTAAPPGPSSSAAAPPPKWETASIKACEPKAGARGFSVLPDGGRTSPVE